MFSSSQKVFGCQSNHIIFLNISIRLLATMLLFSLTFMFYSSPCKDLQWDIPDKEYPSQFLVREDYHILPNKCACLNKHASTFDFDYPYLRNYLTDLDHFRHLRLR